MDPLLYQLFIVYSWADLCTSYSTATGKGNFYDWEEKVETCQLCFFCGNHEEWKKAAVYYVVSDIDFVNGDVSCNSRTYHFTECKRNRNYLDGADLVLEEVWDTNASFASVTGEQTELQYYEPDYGRYASMTEAESYTKSYI